MELFDVSPAVQERFEDRCSAQFELGGEANASVLWDPKSLTGILHSGIDLLFQRSIIKDCAP